uniref:Uncharacterized protein n=1 Tax=Arundo donax TaxID=35708 RepID=A0A0A9HLY3_ARUDO
MLLLHCSENCCSNCGCFWIPQHHIIPYGQLVYMMSPGVFSWNKFTRLFTPLQYCIQRSKAGPGYHQLMLCFMTRGSQEAMILMRLLCC